MDAQAMGREYEAWAAGLRTEYDAFLRETWTAMRAARKGHWIEDTEEQVRQAGEAFRRKALERLLQMRVEAEQEFFSPSAGGAVGQQGPPPGHASDECGARGASPTGVAAAKWRAGHTGR